MRYRLDYKSQEVIDETLELVVRAQGGDSRAENKLVMMYSDYVDYMVFKYTNKTAIDDKDDLRSSIHMGLLEGIRRYDPDKGTQFIYFSHTWMKKMIFIEANKNYRFIRLPINQSIFETSYKNRIAAADDNVMAADNDYFKHINIDNTTTHTFSSLAEANQTDISVKQRIESIISDTCYQQEPEEDIILQLNTNIKKVLNKFSKKERFIIEHVFGLNGKTKLSPESIADRLKVTKVNVSFTKSRVIRLLRHRIFINMLLKEI